ncbi:MAG: 16S rRNA (uracil(1498)-N(3))-methyltransferase [Treponema sp.]|nr:16S rRNA (uracil(1498)-N(3))-methyltransferase [Treponema sp.]
MKQFILPHEPDSKGMIRLNGEDYHYLIRVRRLKTGDCFEALLPGGKKTTVRILSIKGKSLRGECFDEEDTVSEVGTEPGLSQIALIQGLPKGSKMDLIVRQAAEAGVNEIIPFLGEYCEARPNSEKHRRWEKIVREARQQSGSLTETGIRPSVDLKEIEDYWTQMKAKYKKPLGIILHQQPLEKGCFHDYLGNRPDFTALAVGTEGGFSPQELKVFLAIGFKPLTLGKTILRTETAAAHGIAAIRILLLESDAWTSSAGITSAGT